MTMNANGSFSYVPNTGATGQDTFTYRASDPGAKNATATVTMTIAAAPNNQATMASLLDGSDAAMEETEDWTLAY